MRNKFQITDYDIVFSGLKEGEHNYIFKINDTFLKNFDFNELNNVTIEVNSVFIKKNTLMELNLKCKGSYNLTCLLYTSPSPRDVEESRMPSSA